MPPRDPHRRQKLLELGLHLWLTRGYAGFSFADLARGTGIRKASVHHHFATKGALVVALIEHQGELAQGFVAWSATQPAEVVLRVFLDGYARLLDTPDELCAAGAICADLAVLPPEPAALGQRYLAAQRTWLIATLRRGPWSDPTDLADTILAALQGGLQRARASGEPERLLATVRTLHRLLQSPNPTPRTPD